MNTALSGSEEDAGGSEEDAAEDQLPPSSAGLESGLKSLSDDDGSDVGPPPAPVGKKGAPAPGGKKGAPAPGGKKGPPPAFGGGKSGASLPSSGGGKSGVSLPPSSSGGGGHLIVDDAEWEYGSAASSKWNRMDKADSALLTRARNA